MPWMSHAAEYGAIAATVSGVSGLPGFGLGPRGASMITTGWSGSALRSARTPRRSRRRDVTVRRLVDSLPHAEPRVPLDRADDPVEQWLLGEVAVDAGEREPELQPVCAAASSSAATEVICSPKLVGAPHGVVSDEAHTGAGDRGPGIDAARRRCSRPAADRRGRSETPAFRSPAGFPSPGRRWFSSSGCRWGRRSHRFRAGGPVLRLSPASRTYPGARVLTRRDQRRSGEGGIRTLDGGLDPHNALAGRRLQPLGHFSRARASYRTVPAGLPR